MTCRVATTGSQSKFLRSVNQDVVSSLLAKKVVLLARKLDDVTNVIHHLDKTAINLIQAMHGDTYSQTTPSSRPSEAWDHLSDIPRRMYLLRRGPLLAPILQHEDDIDYMRCLFLNAGFEDSLRLIDPPLLEAVEKQAEEPKPESSDQMIGYSVRLERLPLEDLALQSGKVLLLDHHTDMFIWIGLGAKNRTHLVRVCKRYAKKLASSRFPSPTIMIFSEGASMARCLQCRLIPSHQDTREQQAFSFPAVLAMSAEEYRALMAKFHRTDEPSFHTYYKMLVNHSVLQ